MGGKTKQAQRTKNNSRPSNSGRSAELLGTTIPSFVGFTVHTDLGLVPLAPGFSTVESLPDTFDSSVSSQCQLVLRKMSKKDPITKVKALQEFSELVSESDVDFVKTILPLWPKFYHNLANDVEHRVRESAQQAQNAVVTKAGKLIAPYLKQLAPVWISSQFDNYAPVASLASSTFNASFSPKKVQEVFTFCQNEILDYIIKNLTFHTATTLSNTKSCTPEEAENKYQRVIVCSLKSLALYLEKTSGKQTPEIEEKLKNLLQNQKFWSFSKHKATNIRAAWFEILFAFLQHAPNVVEANKNQIIQVTFQNMDDSDPLTLPHVWGCILLIQTIFDDWHVSINFKKAVLPKLSQLLKNAAKTNFDVVHPSLLPFISKFSDDTIPSYSLQEFYTDFFNNIKLSITSLDNSASKAVIGSITATFYECIRYVVQQKNVAIEKSTETPDVTFCQTILNDYIIDVIKWSLTNETIATKYIFIHISTLIAYWSQNSETSKLYSDILEQFWSQIKQLINEDIDYTEEYLKHLVDFIQNLYNASPYHHDNKVKFSDEQDEAAKNTKSKNVVYLLHKRLKEIAIDLARLLIEKSSKEKTVNYITQLKCLTDMFGDAAFYSDITKDNNLQSTVEIFSTFLNEKEPPESAIDIIFEVMMLMEKVERYQHVEKLLKIPNNIVHQWILQRLLSYPLCIEPEIREILSQKNVSEMILKITKEVIEENSKEKFNLLHKCFFQMESGEILINSETVDGIIRIMSEPLITEGMEEMLDTCGSFIAQIMPVICSDNSTKELQHDVFLKLFKFSVNMVENDNLSEDTLWEITTCWQDALSSNDIVMDEMLLINCAKIIEQKISQDDDLAIQEINNIADVTAKLILCSTENLSSEDERNNQIDKIIDQLLDTTSEKYRNSYDYVKNLCLYFESIRGVMTASALRENFNEELPVNDFRNFFRKQLLNVSTVLKLVCNIRTEKQSDIGDNKPLSEDDQEYTEDYFDPNEHLLKVWSEKIYSHILQSINIAAIGESLLVNSTMINDDDEYVILNLTEKCSLILKHSAESFILTIKDRIFETASTTEISWIRTIPFLLNTTQYSDTENGPIILYEDACSYMLENSRFISYINITHIMMPKLGNKNLPINYDVLANSVDLTIRETALRCLISNHFTGDYNQLSDKKIINQCCSLIDEIANKHKEVDNTLLLCDRDIQPVELSKVIFVTEYINLLAEAVEKFSTQLTLKNWDSIRIGLSWWTLSVSKSLENYKNLKVSIFISRVFKLYDALTKFIIDGKTKSSTSMLTNIIDEWENLFSKEVNIVLFKSYYNLVSFVGSTDHVNSGSALLDEIGTYVENLEYSDIFEASKSGFKITTNDIVNFILHNLSNNIYSVRIACLYMLQQLTKLLVSIDFSNLDKHTETVEGNKNAADDQNNEWHLLNKFSPYLLKYENQIHEYIEEFSYKLTELPNLKKINREAALSYLLIWDSIIYICAQAPAELRSIYATWIRDNKYEQTLLNFLFRAMPIEILKNHDSKIMNNDMFRTINWQQHKDPQLSTERYACYLYSQMLRHLPAVVRKWWNATNARQKTFVDKLTTNFVSSLICQEELRAIVEKKEKHENMQVTVHTSTREVVAVYSIDEARMELVITLAPNHPLGAVKVESRKQIGGRAQSRNVGMQLTIFLTHQNGSIFDGLYLWKRNLDKKFEGVEECYVCYTVIHQDTCQLPKLTCQTCKKKFHGPCLYKWFTTSSKSTCPICRNVF